MVQLKRIGVLSMAKIMGIWYAMLGLIGGAIFSLMAVIGVTAGSLSGAGGEEAAGGIIFGIGAIICFPIMYGLMGFVVGALTAFVYNFAAQMIGGIELELSE